MCDRTLLFNLVYTLIKLINFYYLIPFALLVVVLAMLSNYQPDFFIVMWQPGHGFPFAFLNVFFVQLMFVFVEQM